MHRPARNLERIGSCLLLLLASAALDAFDGTLARTTALKSLLTDKIIALRPKTEDTFGITIPDDDYEKIRTVGDAINYIEEKSRNA